MATLDEGQQSIAQKKSTPIGYGYLFFIKNPCKHRRRIKIRDTITLNYRWESEKTGSIHINVTISEPSILTGPVSADLARESD